MKNSMLLAICLLCLGACTDDVDTVRTLEAQGFTNIRTTGFDPFMCGKDDTYSTGFRAKNNQGAAVSGVVCCGLLFKGCTIRF